MVSTSPKITKANRDAEKTFSLTLKIKLLPTPEQAALLDETMQRYVQLSNDLIDYVIAIGEMPAMTSADLHDDLPAKLRTQVIQDVRSIHLHCIKHRSNYPTIKRLIAKWERQAYGVSDHSVNLSLRANGKVQRVGIPAQFAEQDRMILASHKLGGLRLTKKRGNYIAQICYTPSFPQIEENGVVMGVDLGIKCPAVAKTSDGRVKFFGNGRERRAKRRMFKGRRKHLQERKHRRKLKRIEYKERRWMIDQDHKLSREIVDYAIQNGIKTIKMEMLSGIRKRTTSKSRKNSYGINSWSFYRLQQFIVYKARLAGIRILFVDPRYTSQTCPSCGNKHKASDRLYRCPVCGYTKHRDLIGAINILAA